MNQLNDKILGFLFNKRYMDFKTCSHLRPVSAQFNFHASKYFRSLTEFDLSVLWKNFNWDSAIDIETPYTCLIETVTKYCDSMEEMSGIRIRQEKLNFVSRMCLKRLPLLTSIVLSDCSLERLVIWDFLKHFPNLRSVIVGGLENAPAENGDLMPDEEKLVVSELSLDRTDFWRIFRTDQLKKLMLSSSMVGLRSHEDATAFCDVVERCQRLEHLELEVMTSHSIATAIFPPLLHLGEVMTHLEQFNLSLWALSTVNVLQLVHQYPSVGKHAKKLRIYQAKNTGYWFNSFV